MYSNVLSMIETYGSRYIGRYEVGELYISTARIDDGIKPYETAICHPDYSERLIIVEAYDSAAKAQAGHERWIRIMTSEQLPADLTDCCNSALANEFRDEIQTVFVRTI